MEWKQPSICESIVMPNLLSLSYMHTHLGDGKLGLDGAIMIL